VPIGYFRTIGDPRHDWCFKTEPEPGLGGRRLDWPRGKGLGGSSAINGLIYVRGQRQDFDGWGKVASGWSFDEVLPYFKRAERQERGANAWHGAEGPISVSDGRARFRITELFRQSAIAWGLADNPDCNAEHQDGAGYYQTSTSRGWRVSAAHGYLDPVRRRGNLKVETGARVTRIVLEEGRAAGITLRRPDDTAWTYRARGEVILSAGAIGSPQLLMLSGIGPANHLREMALDVAASAPLVGQRLQDHLKFHNAYRVSIPTLNGRLNSAWGRMLMGLEFALTRRGPLTMGAAPVFAFLRSAPDITRPDIQFHVVPWSSDDPAKGFHPDPGFAVSICPLRPQSRGSVWLRSPDPLAAPAMVANYLTEETDRRTILAGLRRAHEICRTAPVADVIEAEIWPGAALSKSPDAELLDAIRGRVSTIFHPVGSVAMGDDDAMPLDPRCRVRGVSRLRVVDASVMPAIVSGNTNAAVNMIAEKASALILDDRP
jgi:choline dehydrogenase